MATYVVGISGASGTILGIRALEALRSVKGAQVHLVMTDQAKVTMRLETSYTPAKVAKLAHVVHDERNLAAAIAYSQNDTLLVRAADVHLKEKRRLVLVVRETPLHLGHLRALMRLAEIGAMIVPPMPGFYHKPKSVDDIVNHIVGKALDALGVPHELFARWKGSR